jgi:hypothetical protein
MYGTDRFKNGDWWLDELQRRKLPCSAQAGLPASTVGPPLMSLWAEHSPAVEAATVTVVHCPRMDSCLLMRSMAGSLLACILMSRADFISVTDRPPWSDLCKMYSNPSMPFWRAISISILVKTLDVFDSISRCVEVARMKTFQTNDLWWFNFGIQQSAFLLLC